MRKFPLRLFIIGVLLFLCGCAIPPDVKEAVIVLDEATPQIVKWAVDGVSGLPADEQEKALLLISEFLKTMNRLSERCKVSP